MRHEKLTEFLANNKEAFGILAEEIRRAKDLDNIKDSLDLEATKKAIEIVRGWIDRAFIEVESEQIEGILEDEPIFKMNKTPEKEF